MSRQVQTNHHRSNFDAHWRRVNRTFWTTLLVVFVCAYGPSWYVTRSTGLSALFAAVVAGWAAVLLDWLAWQDRVRKLTDEFRRLRAD